MFFITKNPIGPPTNQISPVRRKPDRVILIFLLWPVYLYTIVSYSIFCV